MIGMRLLNGRQLTLALSSLLLLVVAALATPPGIIPLTEVLTQGSGAPDCDRTDYWVNTGGSWDEYPDAFLNSAAATSICATFQNNTGTAIRLREMGFSAVGQPSSTFYCGIYTDVEGLNPPPSEEPDFYTSYHPTMVWSPYVSIDLDGAGLYIADGSYFSMYYQVPETGGGLFNYNGYKGWFFQGRDDRDWIYLGDYFDGYSPAFQFMAETAAEELTVCPSGGADFTNIQSAVDAAVSGFTIWLCDDLYYGEGNFNINCKGKDLVIRSISDNPDNCIIALGPLRGGRLDLQKGDAGSDPRSQASQNWKRGDRIPPTNYRAFMFQNGESSAAEVRGVTIQGGSADRGGGIYIEDSSPTIRNCRFVENPAEEYGGGIYCVYSSSEIIDCFFTGNSTVKDGGGGILIAVSNASVTNCIFYDNGGRLGGAAAVYDFSNVTLSECIFLHNIADYGGGVYVQMSELALPTCQFTDNYAYSHGGGLSSYYALVNVSDCVSYNNSCFLGGAFALSASEVLISDSFFYWNEAEFGGAILADTGVRGGHPLAVYNCTIVENGANSGGGIFFDNIDLSVYSSIIAFSTSGTGIDCFNGCSPYIICTNIFGNDDGNWSAPWLAGLLGTNGNFMANPQFCGSVGSGNCELQSDSPCMPGGNSCGTLIGTFGQGCGTQAARSMSWSKVKTLY